MTFDKKCMQLVELYDNTGKEFYQELIAILEGYYPALDHTILEQCEKNEWKSRATTIRDPDEVQFLLRMAENEAISSKRGNFQFSEKRRNVKGHQVIPLVIRYRKMIGIWIIESRWKEKVTVEKEMISFSKLLALFLQASADERSSTINRYIDARTGLLGKQYFCHVVERVHTKKHKVILCAIRWHSYREMIRVQGIVETEERFRKFLQAVKELELGNCYLLSEDTLIVISAETEQEIYAKLDDLLEEPAFGKHLKIVLMDVERCPGLFTHLEERFSLCSPGVIWTKRANPVVHSFVTETVGDKQVEGNIEKKEEEIVDELLEILERRYDL